jgi:hypothetical protein
MNRRLLGIALSTCLWSSPVALPATGAPAAAGAAIEDPLYVLFRAYYNSQIRHVLGRIDSYSVDAPGLVWIEVLPQSVAGVSFAAHGVAYDDANHRLVFVSFDGWRTTFFARDIATGSMSVLFDDATIVQMQELDIDRSGVGYGQHVADQSCLRIDFATELVSVVAPVVAPTGDAVTIAPDGRIFAIDPDTVMRSIDPVTGLVSTIGTTYLWDVAGLDFAADGRLFALTRLGQLYEVDPNTCTLRFVRFVFGFHHSNMIGALGITVATRQPPGWSMSCDAGGATLIPYGTGAVSGTQLSLLGSGLPPGAPGIVIVSEIEHTPVTSTLFAGELCLGSPIVRIGATLGAASPSGMFHTVLDLGQFPGPNGPVALVPGDVRHFQLWYREVTPTTASSFSSAAEVTFR